MDALVRRNPFIIKVRSTIAFGVFDKGFVDGTDNYVFRCFGRHFPPALRQAYHSSGTVVRGDLAGFHVLPATAGLATARLINCV